MATTPTPITPLPTPVPQRLDPVNFASRADNFLTALPTFGTETNNIAINVYNNATEAFTSASNASGSASSAFSSAQAAALAAQTAAAASGATQWISGTSYSVGDVVWSPITFLSYRRKIAGTGTTDPSLDTTNWALIGASSTFPSISISSNTNASATTHYIFTASLQLTLPSSPTVGLAIQFTDLSGLNTSSINPGAEKIRGVSGVMNLNVKWASAILIYTGTTLGWV